MIRDDDLTDSDISRQFQGWIDALKNGDLEAVNESWDHFQNPLEEALLEPYRHTSLTQTAYGPKDILSLTYEWARIRPYWLISNRNIYESDPYTTLWLAWLESAEEILGGVERRYNQVWGPKGLVPRLVHPKTGHLTLYVARTLNNYSINIDAEEVVSDAYTQLISQCRGNAFHRLILAEDPSENISPGRLRPILFRKAKNSIVDLVRVRQWTQALGTYEPDYRDDTPELNEKVDLINRFFASFGTEEDDAREVASHRFNRVTGRRSQIRTIISQTRVSEDQVPRIVRRIDRELLPILVADLVPRWRNLA